jgi:hypothetical protein
MSHIRAARPHPIVSSAEHSDAPVTVCDARMIQPPAQSPFDAFEQNFGQSRLCVRRSEVLEGQTGKTFRRQKP